jgi:hypothetical protein
MAYPERLCFPVLFLLHAPFRLACGLVVNFFKSLYNPLFHCYLDTNTLFALNHRIRGATGKKILNHQGRTAGAQGTRRIEFILLSSSLVRLNQRFAERLRGKIPKFHISV